jgi:two-component system, LytTR family, response regulator LytT
LDIKILCRKDNYETYKAMLEKAGFSIRPDADLTFKEDDFIAETMIGKIGDAYEILHHANICLVESFGHEVVVHTLSHRYEMKAKLYEIEGQFEDRGFIRINKSQIVNRSLIKQIRPAFNSKLTLLLKNGMTVDVTRNYQLRFKEIIGF